MNSTINSVYQKLLLLLTFKFKVEICLMSNPKLLIFLPQKPVILTTFATVTYLSRRTLLATTFLLAIF